MKCLTHLESEQQHHPKEKDSPITGFVIYKVFYPFKWRSAQMWERSMAGRPLMAVNDFQPSSRRPGRNVNKVRRVHCREAGTISGL